MSGHPDYYGTCPKCDTCEAMCINIYADFDVINETVKMSAYGTCGKCGYEIDFENV